MIADLTALGVTTLEEIEDRTVRLTAALLDQLGCGDIPRLFATTDTASAWPRLSAPEFSLSEQAKAGFTAAVDVFGNLTKLVHGAAAVVSFLTGPGVLGACLALAAGAGWWRFHNSAETVQRKQLRAWVESATGDEESGFERELTHRIRRAERYLDDVLPELISARRLELTKLRTELSDLKRAGEQARQAGVVTLTALLTVLTELTRESDELATLLLEGRPSP
jgi:hypothetical protein